MDEAALAAAKIRSKLAARKAKQRAMEDQAAVDAVSATAARGANPVHRSRSPISGRTLSPFSGRVQSPPSRSDIKRAARQMGLHQTLPSRPTGKSREVFSQRYDLAYASLGSHENDFPVTYASNPGFQCISQATKLPSGLNMWSR